MLRRETGIFEEVGWGIEEVGLKKRKLVWGVNWIWMKRNSIEMTYRNWNWFLFYPWIRLVFIFLYIGYEKKKIWAEIFSSFQRRVTFFNFSLEYF